MIVVQVATCICTKHSQASVTRQFWKRNSHGILQNSASLYSSDNNKSNSRQFSPPMVHHHVQQDVQSSVQELAIFSLATELTTWPFPHLSAYNEVDQLRIPCSYKSWKHLTKPHHNPKVAASFRPRARIMHVTRFICILFGQGLLLLNRALGGNGGDWRQPRRRYSSYPSIIQYTGENMTFAQSALLEVCKYVLLLQKHYKQTVVISRLNSLQQTCLCTSTATMTHAFW